MRESGQDHRTKRYVDVVVAMSVEGRAMPLEVVWDDGRRFEVTKVLDRRQAYSKRVHSAGIRYTVRIRGRDKYLWYDPGTEAWFVEAKAMAR